MLPADLRSAEAQTLGSLQAVLQGNDGGRWSIEWRFEGLRLLAPVLRLLTQLSQQGVPVLLLFSDAGGAALARRDAPDLADRIVDFRQLEQRPTTDGVLLAMAPTAADYEIFERLCGRHRGSVVMVNGRLEDAAVGIGSVARERRRGFVSTWTSAYALIPLDGGALRQAAPGPWELYRSDTDGYRLVATFEQKPDGEAIAATLSGAAGAGVASTLRAVDALIEGLRN
ncbi:MAG: DUF1995 family protein [Cyanobacteria bacterium REEB417]|nr:DUF1995 family protein [Cyanobacteria bacterium REEB417]